MTQDEKKKSIYYFIYSFSEWTETLILATHEQVSRTNSITSEILQCRLCGDSMESKTRCQ